MILKVRAKNCFVFSEEIEFSLVADMRNSRFASNVYSENNFNILKTAGIYGQNNSGKTCLIKCIKAIKNILLNQESNIVPNWFTESSICELGVSFIENGRRFDYEIKYNVLNHEYVYERFWETVKDEYGNEKTDEYFVRDTEKQIYKSVYEDINKMLPMVSKSNILIYVINTSSFEKLDEMKNILCNFANRIDVLDMNNIPIEHTIEVMKHKDGLQKKVADFVKNADLYMEDFLYLDDNQAEFKAEFKMNIDSNKKPEEKVLDFAAKLADQIRLTSVYKNIPVPSILFDSTGTKKIAALASYIIEAIEQGRILVIDELDSSIHFKLTRAIVAMFNNELNKNAQLIFTVHDINLMDCKRLFRKEQIWFVHKDMDRVYVYPLSKFTANMGVRDTTDVIEKYKKGALGALPEPELINSLLSISGASDRRDVDE